jgi:hypothetical protein
MRRTRYHFKPTGTHGRWAIEVDGKLSVMASSWEECWRLHRLMTTGPLSVCSCSLCARKRGERYYVDDEYYNRVMGSLTGAPDGSSGSGTGTTGGWR